MIRFPKEKWKSNVGDQRTPALFCRALIRGFQGKIVYCVQVPQTMHMTDL